MAVVDRTNDFLHAAAAQVSAGVRPVSTLPTGRKTPTEGAKAFSNKAAEISRKIGRTSKRLQRLAELTKAQGIFDDPGEEINELASLLQNDTKFLKIELDQLQAFLVGNRQTVWENANASDHSQTVIEAMKMQLHSTAVGFKTVLEKRQTAVQQKNDRKSMFGAKRSPLTPAPSFTAANIVQRRPTDGLPRPQGASGLAPRSGDQTNSFGPSGNESGNQDNEAEFAPLIQQSEQVQGERYLSSRAEAMSSIESHIVELGDVMQQLAHMVVEQGGLVQRIDDNVEAAQQNLSQGHQQLERMWNNLGGNKWLAAKVFFVLLFFITFFVTFLA